ncbi:hypothetical protein AAEI02_03780 [Shewanella xiamenensis]|uniref:hypothetical protein n=1 Tax=Shewanella xiamenensis TaxID=332186 RepID=UPI00313D526D
MKVCVVSPFFIDDKNISRPSFVRESLIAKNIDVLVVTSNYSHQLKKKVSFADDKIMSVSTLQYSSNKSIFRFISHFMLAISLFLKSKKIASDVDIFYVTAPFAITALLLKLFLRKKVIVDIIDYWPNSLPFKANLITRPFLKFWQKINLVSCKKADYTISLSSTFLALAELDTSHQIMFGAKKKFIKNFTLPDSKISIVYLGNVGSLYDFESLLYVFEKYPDKFTFDLIGGGDRVAWLKAELDKIGIEYNFHGVIYCESKIAEIIKYCHFGFNGYLNTNASFSYKALSYFSYGLPIINSMRGDLFNYVEQYGLGFNYTQGCKVSLEKALLNSRFSTSYSSNVCDFFEEFLDERTIKSKIIDLFESVYNEKAV